MLTSVDRAGYERRFEDRADSTPSLASYLSPYQFPRLGPRSGDGGVRSATDLRKALMSKASSYLPAGFRALTVHLTVSEAATYIEFLQRAFDAVELTRSASP